MVKKIFGAALAAMMLFSMNANAQSQKMRSKDGGKARTEMVKERASREFEGLNLTDSQKEQLKQLKEQQRAGMKARKDSLKEVRKADKAQKKAEKKEMRAQREAEKRAYLQQVKQILGNDQYVIFLENQYVQSAPRPDMMKGQKHGPQGRQKALRNGAKQNMKAAKRDGRYKGAKVNQGAKATVEQVSMGS